MNYLSALVPVSETCISTPQRSLALLIGTTRVDGVHFRLGEARAAIHGRQVEEGTGGLGREVEGAGAAGAGAVAAAAGAVAEAVPCVSITSSGSPICTVWPALTPIDATTPASCILTSNDTCSKHKHRKYKKRKDGWKSRKKQRSVASLLN